MSGPAFQLEVRAHLEPRESGRHLLLCVLAEGVVEVGTLSSLKVGRARCFVRVVGLERAHQPLERFELLGREVVVGVQVLDHAQSERLTRLGPLSRLVRPQKLGPLSPKDLARAQAAERDLAAQRAAAAEREQARRRELEPVQAAALALSSALAPRLREGSTEALRAALLPLTAPPLVERLVGATLGVGLEDETLVARFARGWTLRCEPPAPIEDLIDGWWPPSFTRLRAQHRRLSFWPADNTLGLVLDDLGLPDGLAVEGVEDPDVRCPLWCLADCYVYHPSATREGGEAALAFVSHEARGWLRPPEPGTVADTFFTIALALLEDA